MYLSMRREKERRPLQNRESPWSYSRRGRGREPQNDLKFLSWLGEHWVVLEKCCIFEQVKNVCLDDCGKNHIKFKMMTTCADEQQRRIHPKNCGVRELQRKVLEQVVVKNYKKKPETWRWGTSWGWVPLSWSSPPCGESGPLQRTGGSQLLPWNNVYCNFHPNIWIHIMLIYTLQSQDHFTCVGV